VAGLRQLQGVELLAGETQALIDVHQKPSCCSCSRRLRC
jgi:hypothetical protein